MAFVQGKKPALTLTARRFERFRVTIEALGYAPPTGPHVRRAGEFAAWILPLADRRQVHVQAAHGRNGVVDVFAHTEPAGYGLRHTLSALRDQHNFSAGSRTLRGHLRKAGWRLNHVGR